MWNLSRVEGDEVSVNSVSTVGLLSTVVERTCVDSVVRGIVGVTDERSFDLSVSVAVVSVGAIVGWGLFPFAQLWLVKRIATFITLRTGVTRE